MAGNYSVGSAYLSVSYKTEAGSDKKIKTELEKAGEEGGKEGGRKLGEGLERGVSAKAVAIGNLISGAVETAAERAAQVLGDTMQQAFKGFASFEQLEGGIDILFGDNAAQVLENAQRAFETAGMSANDYLEQVMGFSSSLINSLGGDTDAAARMADMALRDMSDNVNTFGSDIASVQRAYQGFARGQFGMLDNLHLGYEGSITEMQRLLDKAEELSGVHYDIGNYADIVEAIHTVQSSMSITGKTAAEAASTVEGSLASLSAAWTNWLVELGKSDGDIEATTDALVQAFGNAAANVVPLVARIISGLIKGLPQVVAQAAAGLPSMIGGIFEAVFGEGAGAGVEAALAGIGERLAPLGEAFARVGEFAGEAFAAVSEVLAALQPQLQPLFDLVALIADVLVSKVLPFVVELVGSGLIAFISGVIAMIGGVLSMLGSLVSFVQGIPGAVMGAFEAIGSGVTSAFETAANAIITAIDGVVSYFAGIPGQIIGFFEGIGEKISGFFSSIHFPQLHIEGSWNPLDWINGKAPSISFYAAGGIVDSPHLGVFGEAGPEAVVPLTPGRLQPFGEAVAAQLGAGSVTNVYINGAKVNDDEGIERSFYAFMRELSRLNTMGAVNYG